MTAKAEKHQCVEMVQIGTSTFGFNENQCRQCRRVNTELAADGKYYCFQHHPDRFAKRAAKMAAVAQVEMSFTRTREYAEALAEIETLEREVGRAVLERGWERLRVSPVILDIVRNARPRYVAAQVRLAALEKEGEANA